MGRVIRKKASVARRTAGGGAAPTREASLMIIYQRTFGIALLTGSLAGRFRLEEHILLFLRGG
jgi:hypothetical protein